MQHGPRLPMGPASPDPHVLPAGTAATSLPPHTLQPPGHALLPTSTLHHTPPSNTGGRSTHDVAPRDVAEVPTRRLTSEAEAPEGRAAPSRREGAAPAPPPPPLMVESGAAATSTEPCGSPSPCTASQSKGVSDSSESMSDGDEEYRPPSPTTAAARASAEAENESVVGRTTRARRPTSATDRHNTKVPRPVFTIAAIVYALLVQPSGSCSLVCLQSAYGGATAVESR